MSTAVRCVEIVDFCSEGWNSQLIILLAGVAQLVEQRFCKPQVVGSSPFSSSKIARFDAQAQIVERYPSGQRDQTVNLTAYAFEGSNPSLSTKYFA
jgi:hypothetical protein